MTRQGQRGERMARFRAWATPRRVVQAALLALFVYLLSLARWPLSEAVLTNAFLSLDPLLSLQAAIAGRTWVPALIYGIALLAATVLLGRFFCGWMCPMGTLIEWSDDLVFGRGRRRVKKNHERIGRGVKYGVLLVILIAAAFGEGLAYLADPICWATRLFAYVVWPVAGTLAVAASNLLRPVFEALGWMNLARAEITPPVFGPFGVVALLFFIGVVALGRLQRRFWCRSLCPLGALLALAARFTWFHRKVAAHCTAEGKCSRVCETGAIGEDYTRYDPAECIQCGSCAKSCHTGAVTFAPGLGGAAKDPRVDLSRRAATFWLAGGAVAATWIVRDPMRLTPGDELLRPPGALPENDFLATCVRCGQCVKACPTHMLQSTALAGGVAGFMSPTARMRLGPCDQNCTACGGVCPTGAIRVLDLVEKTYAKIGNAVIEPGRCVVWEQGRVCLVCDEHCPYGAIDWKEVDGERRPQVNENKCNGCGACEHACPVDGRSAIRVFPAGQIRLAVGSYADEAALRGLILEDRPPG